MGAPLSENFFSLRAFSHLGGFCLAASALGEPFPFGSALLSEAFLFGTSVPLFPAPGPSLPDFRPSVPSPSSRLSSSGLSPFRFLPQRFFPSGLRLSEGLSLLSAFASCSLPFPAFAFPGSPLGDFRPWWVAVDSNHRPLAYQASALTN